MILKGVNDGDEDSPLDEVVRMHDSDRMLYLAIHGCGNSKFKDAAIIKACFYGRLEVAKKLIEQHNINPKGNHDYILWGLIMPGMSGVCCSTYCQVLLSNNYCIPSQM